MRRVDMDTSTCLVCDKRLDAEALCIPATGGLGWGHLAAPIQRFVIAFGPTTQPQDWTIRRACAVDLRERAQPAWLATRPSRLEAAGLALPRRHGARGRAARVGPARLLQRWRPAPPIACPLPPHPPLHLRGEEPAAAFAQGALALCGP